MLLRNGVDAYRGVRDGVGVVGLSLGIEFLFEKHIMCVRVRQLFLKVFNRSCTAVRSVDS